MRLHGAISQNDAVLKLVLNLLITVSIILTSGSVIDHTLFLHLISSYVRNTINMLGFEHETEIHVAFLD
jgi:hypothetical protein